MRQRLEQPGKSEELKSLKDHALRNQTAEFVNILRRLLVKDFEVTFAYLKHQKLINKFRNPNEIADISRQLEKWLPKASLSGKRKALIRRHLQACYEFQRLFSTIDKLSRRTSLWHRPWHEVWSDVLSHVERRAKEVVDSHIALAEHYGKIPSEYIAASASAARSFRDDCDAALHLLTETLRTNVDSDVSEKDFTLEEVLGLARLFDVLLQIFNSYTYAQYRVSLRGNRLTVQPALNRASYAKFVAYQRQHSSDQINAMHSSHLVREVFARFADQEAPAWQEFEDFTKSHLGKGVLSELWGIAPAFEMELTTEIEKILQVDQTFKTAAGKLSVRELIRFWSFLLALSRCARFWQDKCSTPNRSGVTVPTLSYQSFENLGTSFLNLQPVEFAKYFRQFSTVPAPNTHPDLFYRPLVQLPNGRVLLPLSYIETSRFPRNLITIAIKESDLDVAARGTELVATLQRRLSTAAFRVAENVRLVENGRRITDIDILFAKENVLFVGQTKIVVQPDSGYEVWKAKQRLTHAAEQLSLSLRHLDYLPAEVHMQLGLTNIERVVPFLLTNAWDLTGTTINGYPVVDFSYLGFIADGAQVGLVVNSPIPRRTGGIRFIEGDVPSAGEMEKMLSNPIHEAMYDVPELVYIEVPFFDRVLVLPSSIHATQLPSSAVSKQELT